MKQFIEVTEKNEKIVVNVNTISIIRKSEDGVALYLEHHEPLIVSESYDEIKSFLQ
ncbi:hypothetical protein AGMMS4957_19700 [Bacteroidia bacterium]|nr:hypothetical protein AGMMS4957_19700 [Bacteroidia bacterium]